MDKKLKITSLILLIMLVLSIVIIAVLATLLVVEKQKDIDFAEANTQIEQDKTYDLSNVNFRAVSDTEESVQSVNVTCKVKPFNATNKNLNWSLSWKNASSEWATGKTPTDYVQVVVDNTDTRNANITMLKAFGEIIMLNVSSVSNPEVTTSVELRCIAEIDFVTSFEFGGVEYSFNKDSFSNGQTELVLHGGNYEFPKDSPEAFKIKTRLFGATSTNLKETPFVTFKFHRYYYYTMFGVLYDFYTTYDYLNDNTKKVPLIQIENNKHVDVLPSDYRNPEAVTDDMLGGEQDVSTWYLNVSSLEDLLYQTTSLAIESTNSRQYAYFEIKFMGTGATLKLYIDCKAR